MFKYMLLLFIMLTNITNTFINEYYLSPLPRTTLIFITMYSV